MSLFADHRILRIIEGAHLACVLKNHPALGSVMNLLPENVLVSGDENVPGLAASPTGKLYITGQFSGHRVMCCSSAFTLICQLVGAQNSMPIKMSVDIHYLLSTNLEKYTCFLRSKHDGNSNEWNM